MHDIYNTEMSLKSVTEYHTERENEPMTFKILLVGKQKRKVMNAFGAKMRNSKFHN